MESLLLFFLLDYYKRSKADNLYRANKPLHSMPCPVIKPDLFDDAKKRQRSVISSTVPRRFKLVCLSVLSNSFGGTVSIIGVFINPGNIQFARTLNFAISTSDIVCQGYFIVLVIVLDIFCFNKK